MPITKVTSNFQVAIPKVILEAFGLKPEETVSVESIGKREIVIKRSIAGAKGPSRGQVTEITSEFQVTIPKVVREAFGLKPEETVSVESIGKREIVIKRTAGTIMGPMLGRIQEEWTLPKRD